MHFSQGSGSWLGLGARRLLPGSHQVSCKRFLAASMWLLGAFVCHEAGSWLPRPWVLAPAGCQEPPLCNIGPNCNFWRFIKCHHKAVFIEKTHMLCVICVSVFMVSPCGCTAPTTTQYPPIHAKPLAGRACFILPIMGRLLYVDEVSVGVGVVCLMIMRPLATLNFRTSPALLFLQFVVETLCFKCLVYMNMCTVYM